MGDKLEPLNKGQQPQSIPITSIEYGASPQGCISIQVDIRPQLLTGTVQSGGDKPPASK